MGQDDLQYVISAVDKTQAGFDAAYKSMEGHFAHLEKLVAKSTGGWSKYLAAPFRALGSMNVFAAVQNIETLGSVFRTVLDTGREWATDAARHAAVTTEFANRTGAAGDEVFVLGRRLEEASHGAVGLETAMAKANEYLARGLNTDQIAKIWDYASIKAKTTGQDFGELSHTIGRAFATGRTMALSQLGLIKGGTQGVAEAFEKLNTGKHWSSLSQGQKLAETMAFAMREMDNQIKASGLHGNELVFNLDRAASALSDSWDIMKEIVMSSPVVNRMADSFLRFARNAQTTMGFNRERYGGMMATVGESLAKSPVGRALGSIGGGLTAGASDGINGLMTIMGRLGIKLSEFATKIEQVFSRLGASILSGLSNVFDALKFPLADVIGTLFKSDDLGIKFALAMDQAAFALSQGSLAAERHANSLDPVLQSLGKDMIELNRQAAQLPDHFEKAEARARAGLGLKEGIRGLDSAVRGIGNVFTGALQGAFGSLRGIAGEANKALDMYRAAFDRAADAVKDAADAMKTASQKLWETMVGREQNRYEVALERVGGERTPQGRTMMLEQAATLTWKAQYGGGTPEQAEKYLERAGSIVGSLQRMQPIYQDPQARGLTDRMERLVSGELVRNANQNVNRKADALREAERTQEVARGSMVAERGRQEMQLFGQAAHSASGIVRDFEGALKSAGNALLRMAKGQGGGTGAGSFDPSLLSTVNETQMEMSGY